MISFFIFDRWGKQLGTIQNVTSAVHIDELNGEDSLTLEFEDFEVTKGQRIVWKDKFGAWHEHIISDFTVHHAEGRLYTTAYAENSISELMLNYITWKKPVGNASIVIAQALQGSRWTNGNINVLGNVNTNWYHISSYEAIKDIIENIGGELSTTITINGAEVTGRAVNLLSQRGGDYGRLFVYGRNTTSIERVIEPGDVYTALYGYGKGLPTYDENDEATGGYSNKLTFGSVNGGQDWIGDDEARQLWGIPDERGGISHAFGQVEFSDCEDPQELLQLTRQALDNLKHPFISYTASVISFAQAGFTNGEDVQTGDTVYIQDKELNERITGRVLKVERNLLDESQTTITLGNLTGTLTDSVRKQESNLDWLNNRSAAWDSSTGANPDWLKHLQKSLDEQFDAVNNYHHQSFEQGEIWSTVPLDENGKPLHTPGMAMQLTGMGFRIASTVDSNGEFEWTTFGTGEGFTADCINAGIIRGGANWWDLSVGDLQFEQGRIGDVAGTTYWDLTNKRFKLTEKNGNGIVYENGKLTIDASNVSINATSIDTWTTSQIKAAADSITLSVTNLKNSTESSIKVLENSIATKVTAADVQSAITQTINSIDLSVTDGKLGSTASIKISANGKQLDSATVDLKGVRNAFKDDTTAITITGGTVTFNSNTFVVNSSYFSVSANGTIKATSGTIGGFTITATNLYNDTIELVKGGMYVTSDEGTGRIGHIGKTWIDGYPNDKGVRIGLVSGSYNKFIDLAAIQNGSSYKNYMRFIGRSLQSSNAGAPSLQISCNTNFNSCEVWSARLRGCRLDLNDLSYFNGSMTYGGVSGTVNTGNDYNLTFIRGILTSAVAR